MAAAFHSAWLSLSRNFTYVAEHLRLDARLLRRLVDVDMVSVDDYEELGNEMTPHRKRVDRLLRDILLRQDPKRFPTFCKILTELGQEFIVKKMRQCDGITSARDLGCNIGILSGGKLTSCFYY